MLRKGLAAVRAARQEILDLIRDNLLAAAEDEEADAAERYLHQDDHDPDELGQVPRGAADQLDEAEDEEEQQQRGDRQECGGRRVEPAARGEASHAQLTPGGSTNRPATFPSRLKLTRPTCSPTSNRSGTSTTV